MCLNTSVINFLTGWLKNIFGVIFSWNKVIIGCHFYPLNLITWIITWRLMTHRRPKRMTWRIRWRRLTTSGLRLGYEPSFFKIKVFDLNFRSLTKISFFLTKIFQNFIFWLKFHCLTKISFFGQHFSFWLKFNFLTKKSYPLSSTEKIETKKTASMFVP